MEKTGRCNICGKVRRLTREHFPPQGSYGPLGARTEVQDIDQYLDRRRGKIYQAGFYAHVLCAECNNLAGVKYGNDFSQWSRWGHSVLESLRTDKTRPIPAFEGYPLRVGKQILATLVASASPKLTDFRPDIRTLLLEPERPAEPGTIDLRGYFCVSAHGRSTGVATALKLGHEPHRLVESALPPFGYVLTLSGTPYDPRPLDISWFLECEYDARVEFDVSGMPLLPTLEPLPGDYRSKDEIRRDVVENILIEKGHASPRDEANRMMENGLARAFLEGHGEQWDSWT